MRKSKGKRKQLNCKVAVEIQRSHVALLVAKRDGDQLSAIRGHHMEWLQDADSLHSPEGVRELTAALATFVSSEKISGAGVHVSLSSEFCVTRVAAGEMESLKPEVRELHDRCSRYLTLGVGEKVVAESTRATDAKNAQTWLTVANKKTVDNVIAAIEQAGLSVEFVEHSLVALCRVVGKMGHDAERPVILIDVNERGVDLGVSYQGQLLFDYRPGGLDSKDKIAEIVGRHLERIQRYCNRQFRFVTGSISEVFLCGVPDELEAVRRQFETSTLNAQILDPRGISPQSYAPDFTPSAYFVAPMGSLLVETEQLQQPAAERGLPDLLDACRSRWRDPLFPALIKSCWPIAATLFLAIGMYGVAARVDAQAASIEAEQQSFENDLARIKLMQMETETATKRIAYLEQIANAVSNRPFHELLAAIGQSLPEGVWLENLSVEQNGLVAIQGPSDSGDQIFQFIEQLKKVPQLTAISLESQQPVLLKRGPAIRFEIKCRYAERNDNSERTASDD